MYYKDQLILTGKINNVGAAILTNIPESYRQGIEIESTIRLLKDLNWNGNISFSRNIIPVFVDFTDNWDTSVQDETTLKNKTISFSPSVVAGSVLDYNPFRDFHLILSTKYVGKQYIDNTQNSERMLNEYLVNNLSFLYTIKNKTFKEMTFQFLINNVLNQKYETNAWVYKYSEGGSLHVMDGYFPQARRNYMLRVDLKF
jgi:iron complex outermembrane receptor protein